VGSWAGSGKVECPACGVTHEAEGTWTDGALGIAGESPNDPDSFEADEAWCPACATLMSEPPESPCCGGKLLGATGDDFAEPFWRCEECDHTFCVSRVRTYRLGLYVEGLIRNMPQPAPPGEHRAQCESIGAAVVAFAGRLGIRRGSAQ